jgi:outer membrane protein TolC
MGTKEGRFGKGLLVMLAAATAMIGSCVSYDPTPVDTYVGPSGVSPTAPPTQAATSPATAPSAELPAVPPEGPIHLNVYQALVIALNNNKALVVDKYNPPIRRTFEDEDLSAFDPVLFGGLLGARSRTISSDPSNRFAVTDGNGVVGLTEFLPTGTHLFATAGGAVADDTNNGEGDNSRLGLSATQSLLRGYGLDVNLAALHQARLDTLSSEYELRGLAISVLAQTEESYWDYVLSLRQLEIVTESLDLAQKQLDEINARIRAERMPETERAAAEAEVALRREDVIDANSAIAKNRLALLRLVSPPGPGMFDRPVAVEQQPIVKDIPIDPLEEHLSLAERMRPDLNQARLLVNRNELDIVTTRNGMLPQLDLFVALGKSGYADSFGRSSGDVFTHGSYDATVGVVGSYPLGNRGPRAAFDRAVQTRDQSLKAVDNLAQLVEVDVRTSYIEVLRTREQIVATAATRKLQEVKLDSETKKFQAGRSTSLQVAQVQRDLEASQLNEVQAMVNCLKAYVELYRLDGSLLERRGIAAPGKDPVRLTAKQ